MTEEQSTELARIIEMVKIQMIGHRFDAEYANRAVAALRTQATRQESMAVLFPSHIPAKNDLLRAQADTLDHLVKFYEGLQSCEELKKKVSGAIQVQGEISKLFI